MSQQDINDVRLLVAALDQWRDLCDEWRNPPYQDENFCERDERPPKMLSCRSPDDLEDKPRAPFVRYEQWRRLLDDLYSEASATIGLDPDLWKSWETTCDDANKRFKSIIERLQLSGPAVVRLVHAAH